MDFDSLFLRIKDGRAERLMGTERKRPSTDPNTGVSSKDVILVPETGVSARFFLPKNAISHNNKLPLLVYFHGGGFCAESPFSPVYHYYLNSLVSQLNVVAVSVDYRLAPEHPLPTAYEDSWAALQWVASNSENEAWIRDFADLNQVFLAGDSAGANICHHMALKAVGGSISTNVKLAGVILINPYFWGEERIGSEVGNYKFLEADLSKLWFIACPTIEGLDEPFINPVAGGAPSLKGFGCKRVLICVAEKDPLRDRGWLYYETLRNSGWEGVAEIVETMEEGHVFHLFQPESEKAGAMMKRLVSFVKQK